MVFSLVLRPFATEGKNVGYMLFFHSSRFLKTIIIFLGSRSEQKVSVTDLRVWRHNTDVSSPSVTNKMNLSRSGQNFSSFLLECLHWRSLIVTTQLFSSRRKCLPFVLATPAHCSFLNAFAISAVWVFCLFFTQNKNPELICEMVFELPNRS